MNFWKVSVDWNMMMAGWAVLRTMDIPACWKSRWTEGERAKDEHLLRPALLVWPGRQMDLLFNIQAMSILSSDTPTLSSILPTPTTSTLYYWLRPSTSNNQINYSFYLILFFLVFGIRFGMRFGDNFDGFGSFFMMFWRRRSFREGSVILLKFMFLLSHPTAGPECSVRLLIVLQIGWKFYLGSSLKYKLFNK